ncbi:protein GOLM2 isoform X1 [Ictalurus furcatus]|uniref:protein GOLM2 isoform X1 n=1 Tax=Ictalurus furcatus TaxID=66913 RepID=UPI00235058AF|nr:protein GOLM2 isoform X1 [Ictalurus furcatus]
MVGLGANRRVPSFVLVGMMVVLILLSYNYWSVSQEHQRAIDELVEVHAQVKRTDAARTRLEKRNSELMLQVDTHRRQIDQKDGDYSMLEGKLQAQDVLVKKCTDEKMRLQSELTQKTSDINRLKEQVKEMRDEIIRQEEQLREVKKNNTNLERKMEYESLQCGRQIAQLKDEYEESKKLLEEKATKLKKETVDARKAGTVVTQAERGTEAAGAHHLVAGQRHDNPDIKDDLVKPGSDAGMPGIEDSEVGKVEDMQFALKKPAITAQNMEPVEQDKQPGAGAGAGPDAGPDAGADAAIDTKVRAGAGAGEGPGFDAPRGLPLDRPDLPQDGGAAKGLPEIQQQVPQPVVDRPVALNEGNKAAVQADEFGEQQRQMRDPENPGAALPPPPNPAHVLPNPMDPQRDAAPAAPLRHRQSRFFDENESPVDPQRNSKLADYNGDDGNVGEYEADKQAELAYNEEEDGDGGEEDAQDDEDRDAPGDRGVDYGKRHQAIDIL